MDPDPALDRRLVDALRHGTRDQRRAALTELFQRYSRALLSVALRVMGERERAEDVVQEVFLALPRTVRSWREDASLLAWLYRITTNKSIDLLRHEGRRPTVRMPETGGADERVMPRGQRDQTAPPERLAEDDYGGRVQAALMELSPKLRAVAVLRHVQGLSYEEIGTVLELELGTVKSRLNRAHVALRQILGPPPED